MILQILWLSLVMLLSTNQSNLIEWNAERKLTWEDFKAQPDKTSTNAALTSSSINIEFGYTNTGLKYNIKCRFDKNLSWGRIKNDYILAHEQGHFDIAEKVGEEATSVFQKIGLLKKTDIKNEDKENRAYRRYLYHGISHHLGLDVHDLGTRTEPISAGMLFTVEPGIYIEEEQMGIRIENNVWITRTGNKDLMAKIPITADDIEALMKGGS